MRYQHVLFIVAFIFSESLALDNIQTCAWKPNGDNYIKHLTAIAKQQTDTDSFWTDMSYNTYARHRDEISKNWDEFVLDESRRPHKPRGTQPLYLKKISEAAKHYNFWQYIDDIMCVNVIGAHGYPDGFMQDEKRANQIVRVNISSHRKYKYHTSKERTARNLNRLYQAIKPTIGGVYNKITTFLGMMLTFIGFDIDWRHFADRYYIVYDTPVADGFVEK